MRLLPFRPVLTNPALVASPDAFFAVVKEDYRDYRDQELFVTHERECLLVYRLREAGQVYTGLLCGLPAAAYDEGAIKQHEGTLAASEQQQLQLLLLRRAMVKPVLLSYPAVPDLDTLLERAVATAPELLRVGDEDGTSHELYELTPGTQLYEEVVGAFAKTIPAVYIADGHHRCSTVALYNRQLAAKGQPAVPLLAGLFSSTQVRINPYHRVIQLPVDLSPLTLLARLSQVCSIEPLATPEPPRTAGEFTMFLQDEAFSLRFDAGHFRHGAIDAGAFNDFVARDLFGIRDIRTDQRVTYVPGSAGVRGITELVQHRSDKVGFMLYPVAPEQLFDVVDRGEVMPPKSTWFEPRLRNGLVVLEF